jgi:hypothetical protein
MLLLPPLYTARVVCMCMCVCMCVRVRVCVHVQRIAFACSQAHSSCLLNVLYTLHCGGGREMHQLRAQVRRPFA